jgi:hypothetical protein
MRSPGVHPQGRAGAKAAESAAAARSSVVTSGAGDASKSKSELYQEAKDAGIRGRSAMNKEQLLEALRKHRASSPWRMPATARAHRVARPASTPRQPRSEERPSASETGSPRGIHQPPDAPRPDRCAIVYRGSGRIGEFQVVVTETGGAQRSVARSPAFRVPRAGPIPRRGSARIAHELLARRLEVCGWWPVGTGRTWHELAFVRLRTTGMSTVSALITLAREAGKARFVAEELDTYGNPTPLKLSAEFRASRFRRVRPSMEAKAALKQLVRRMASEGWKLTEVGGKNWYAVSLSRPIDTNWEPLGPRSRLNGPAAERA